MSDKLQVKEHLRNGALYASPAQSSLGGDWKRRLLYRRTLHQQLKSALRERRRLLEPFVRIGVPILCVVFAFAAYFGYIHPEHWPEAVGRLPDFDVPSIGLKEAFLFIAAVNGLVFLIRKRDFVL